MMELLRKCSGSLNARQEFARIVECQLNHQHLADDN
jgi:hypothetical protein